jgi:hypothetical protein
MSQEKWEELTDRTEVSRTLYDYAHGVDRRDWPGFRDCFCDEVEIDLSSYNGQPPVTMSLDDWVESVRSGLSGFEATQHISANHLIEIEGDRAHATSEFQASHMLEGERVVLAGWYDTQLRRERGRWRISRSQLNATWTQGPVALYARAAERFAAMQSQD